jgi:hypothetical protein
VKTSQPYRGRRAVLLATWRPLHSCRDGCPLPKRQLVGCASAIQHWRAVSRSVPSHNDKCLTTYHDWFLVLLQESLHVNVIGTACRTILSPLECRALFTKSPLNNLQRRKASPIPASHMPHICLLRPHICLLIAGQPYLEGIQQGSPYSKFDILEGGDFARGVGSPLPWYEAKLRACTRYSGSENLRCRMYYPMHLQHTRVTSPTRLHITLRFK